jgi:hypothetical protein
MKSIIYFLASSIFLLSCSQNKEHKEIKIQAIFSYETLDDLKTAPSLKSKTISPAVAFYMHGDSTIPMGTDTFSQNLISILEDSLIIDFGEDQYHYLSFSRVNDKNHVSFRDKEGIGSGIKKTVLKKFEIKIDTSKLIGHLNAIWKSDFEVNETDYYGFLIIDDDFKLTKK